MSRMSNVNLRRSAAVVLRQYYLLRSSPVRLLPIFIWIGIDILLWGFITRYLNTVAHSGFNFVPALLGAVLMWDFFVRIMHGIATAFFEDVWTRNFLNFFATPLTVTEYVIGLVVTSIGTSIFGLLMMVLIAALFFGLSILSYGTVVAAFLLSLFLFAIGIGVLACAIVLRYGPAAEWFVWPIPAIISPLACVFYPVAVLPKWMQFLAHLLPPSYVFESLRAVSAGQPPQLLGLLISGILSLLYIAAAGWVFTTVFRHALRSGLIARYSAESVN